MPQISIELLLIACSIVMVSSAIQTALGFGLALIAVPFLILIDVAMVPAPVLMMALVQLSLAMYSYWRYIRWSLLTMAFVGRIPGTFVAMALMNYFALTGIKLVIAAIVLAAVILSLLSVTARPNQLNHFIAGFFSGITGTTSGIGGPPMALLYQKQSGNFVRANLSAFFWVGGTVSLAAMASVGYVTEVSFWYALIFLPSTALGIVIGRRIKPYLPPTVMRPAILSLCSLSAIAVLLSTFYD